MSSRHKHTSPEDKRKRVRKQGFEQGPQVPTPELSLNSPLGRTVAAVLWYRWHQHAAHNGGEAVLLDRNWRAAHMTPENAQKWVEQHLPGLAAKIDANIRRHPNYRGLREQTFGFKMYRRIWGGYHDRKEQDPKRRHGHYGPRHPMVHKELGEELKRIEAIAQAQGPNFTLPYDLE